MFKKFILLLSIILSLSGCSKVSKPSIMPNGKWIDLTHDFSSETIYWPTSEKFMLEKESPESTKKDYHYEANKFCAAEHGGTHVDAPIHFFEAGNTIDEVPVEQLVGDAIVINISDKALKIKDYQITIKDIKLWEKEYKRIPEGSLVFFYTGFSQYWPDPIQYLGTDERGPEAISKLHFPALHPEATLWLTEERKIKAVGIDTASIDFGPSEDFQCHQVLCSANVLAFENVANLDKLPPTGSYVFALPMKIKGGSGGPTRIVALVSDAKM